MDLECGRRRTDVGVSPGRPPGGPGPTRGLLSRRRGVEPSIHLFLRGKTDCLVEECSGGTVAVSGPSRTETV